jgi:hypothetical protein
MKKVLSACQQKRNIESPCGDELINMTAKTACEQRREKSKEIWESMADVAGNLTPGGIISALSSKSDSKQDILNNLNIDIDLTTITHQMSQCSNVIVQIQSNSIKAPGPACIKAWTDANFSPEDIKEALTYTGIYQENKVYDTSECEINMVMYALTNADATIDNLALQDTINKAKGLMSSSSGDQYMCNNINTKMSACKYLQQSQCCSAILITYQHNEIGGDGGCPMGLTEITQMNDASKFASCMHHATTTAKDEVRAETTNKVTQKAVNKSEGFTMEWLIIIIIIMCVVGLGGPAMVLRSAGKIFQKLLMIGFIFLLVGIICIIMYYVTGRNITSINQPLYNCDPSDGKQTTYGQAKNNASSNNDVIGYDFFPDDIKTNPGNITDRQSGIVVYIKEFDGDSPQCDELDTDKLTSISKVKTPKNKWFLIFGIIFLAFGAIAGLIGIYQARKGNKHQAKNMVDAVNPINIIEDVTGAGKTKDNSKE